ncbi:MULTISPECIES: transposase [unclassified Clostridioides]|uniref:transposase n=1 Tax=unclassified Clostridioides TaxID=2635829 RepID=UPI001D10E859|nr:transposase [Clostridioides sp. ZZV14-6150]MCC0661585.1 transposase [Clostridioides sp. ZZV14-6154]MCC0668958.1 transposase [Clostridioides sp. ZZV14-6153]MCC0718226.1 transposase [Clostridioides sp. ZZV14-6105]MCC0721567.1 transposase [Clostridioides sp. ZZV14-6104]MCC0739531.1 transposase [Clostridioides sp. ZZV14-5902]MCC0743898.1 transposase [Clostridioides sp. ZZV14-6044]MCC0750518.1 transposase [Clostridioides sp. ZZV13-5731]
MDNNSHSVFKLHYKLVMCIKYRRKVIDDFVRNELKNIFIHIEPNYGVEEKDYEKRYISCN